jgi:hypothetical protein
MKYCTGCGAEYQDSAEKCSDCEVSELVSREEMRRRGIPLATDRDTRRFVSIGTAEDPLTQQALVRVLEAEKIPVYPRARAGGSVDMITTPSGGTWWELLVPEEMVDRARLILEAEREKLKSTEEEAVKAAEEEATSTPSSEG